MNECKQILFLSEMNQQYSIKESERFNIGLPLGLAISFFLGSKI